MGLRRRTRLIDPEHHTAGQRNRLEVEVKAVFMREGDADLEA
jgi:hypothetical protein